MNISVSLLSAYQYCPRKIFLERVLKLYEPPKEALLLGTIRHEIYELINNKEEEIVTNIQEKTSNEELETTYKNIYSKILRNVIIKHKENLKQFEVNINELFKRIQPLIQNEAKNRSNNISIFINKHNIFGKELWEKLTPKIQSEIKIRSATLNLTGIIDQLEIYEDSFTPIELKTGKAPKEGAWPGHKIQIAAYAMLLEEKHNTKIKEGFIHYLDINERRHIPINIFLKEEIIQLIEKVKTLLQSKTIPDFCNNKNKCNVCGLRTSCYDKKLKVP